MKCFTCGSHDVAKRLKPTTRVRLANNSLPTDQEYCGKCISNLFNGCSVLKTESQERHTISISQIESLRERCESFANCGGQPSYEKLLKLKAEVAQMRTWAKPVVLEFGEAVKRARELSDIVNAINSSLTFSERAVARMVANSYEARRAAANAFTANRSIRELVFKRDGTACRRCGTSENPSLDHIVSVLDGGEDHIRNMQVLCVPCNSSKGCRSEAA